MKFWHDLTPGDTIVSDARSIEADAIREFATEFDPQPYHLDEDAANASIFGGLCASGWQVNALSIGLLSDAMTAKDIAFMGLRSVPKCRWKIPVFAGDSISATAVLKEKSADSQNEKLGIWSCTISVHNQDEKPVLEMDTQLLIARNDL